MRHYQVQLAPSGWEFAAGEDQSILVAAEQGGFELPSSCRNGSCRTCLCKLEQGTIRYLVEWPGVSADERKAGWILPCVAVPVSELRLTVEARRMLQEPVGPA